MYQNILKYLQNQLGWIGITDKALASQFGGESSSPAETRGQDAGCYGPVQPKCMGIRTQLMMVLCESALTSVRTQAQSRCPPKEGWLTGWSQIIQLQLSETCWDNRTCTVSKIRSHSPREALRKQQLSRKKTHILTYRQTDSLNVPRILISSHVDCPMLKLTRMECCDRMAFSLK